jgi:hypothetical protein
VQVLDHHTDRRYVGRHLERPVLPVLAALVQVLAVRAVAGDDVEGFADDEVFERGGVHFFLGCFFRGAAFLLLGFFLKQLQLHFALGVVDAFFLGICLVAALAAGADWGRVTVRVSGLKLGLGTSLINI